MSERLVSDSAKNQTKPAKMSEGDLGTRKTLFVLVIVVGCFAVLWPKVFYPMMVGPTNQRMKPSNLDKGCCDVISDIDVNTIKIMTELCNSIIQQSDVKPLKGPEIIIRCRTEVLNKCGIDISAVLQEQVRLGRSFKQIVDEVRSFNGSLCLKYKFGVSPWRLGVSHRVTVNLAPVYIRQERPAHLRPEMLHPALREKGRAIPQPYPHPGKPTQAKFVEGRPGPVPGVRPPLGAGAGHVVHPQQKGLNSMGIIMPIYTVGIVIFFSYTLMKLLFKKKPEGPGGALYPPVEPSMTFRKEVFEAVKNRPPRQPGSRDEELDHLRRRLRETEFAMERIVAQMAQVPLRSQKEPTSNTTSLANGSAKSQEHEQPSVKVLGMEMTASCEGGERWSRPESPVIPNTPPPPHEPVEPPQEIYLEGALPAQSQLLVTDSTTETETSPSSSSADPAVVLASKMTLSVISLDSQEIDNGVEPIERNKLRNGDIIETEHEPFDDDLIDESKYTTASGATAAERDISEGERTDGEDGIEEEIEKLPELVVDNGVQQIEDDIEAELNLEYRDEENKEVKFSEEMEPPVESISDVIDNILNVARGESELRSRSIEKDFQETEPEPSVKFSTAQIGNYDDDKPKRKSAIKFSTDLSDDEDDEPERKSAVKFSTGLLDDEDDKPKRKSGIKFSSDLLDDDDDKPERKSGIQFSTGLLDDEDDKPKRKSGIKFSTDLLDDEDDEPERKSGIKFSTGLLDDEDDLPKRKSPVKFSTDLQDDEPERKSAIKFSTDDIVDDEEKPIDLMSAEDIENIGDVIDDVINIGTRMSELISAEREADSDELDEGIVDEAFKLKFKSEEILDLPSEEEYEKAVVIDNIEDSPEIKNIDPTEFRRISSGAESTDDDSAATVEIKPK